MLGALIVVFREVIEAGLIIGIALAVTRGLSGARAVIFAGAAAGLVGALIVAGFTEQLSGALAGRGQEFFNAGVLGFAVLMLAWHNIWMARHGRELARELSSVGRSVATGEKGFLALAVVVGVAVLREGAEVALFLYGILISGESTANLVAGGLMGLALGAGLSFLTFYGLVKIPPGRLFAATSVLVTLLAAGLGDGALADALGHLGDPAGQRRRRAHSAHADRLCGPAVGAAGRRLSRDDWDDRRRDAARRRAFPCADAGAPGSGGIALLMI